MILKKKERLSATLSIIFILSIVIFSIEAGNAFENKLKKYTGKKVSLDFQDAEIKSILRSLAEVSGFNLVIDPDVKGVVNISLPKPVPWDQAFDIILKINGLDSEVNGSIIRVATAASLQEEKQKAVAIRMAQQKLSKAEKKALPLYVEMVSINYSKADKIRAAVIDMLSKPNGLAENPSILVDRRTNTLIIKDLPKKINAIKQVIKKLDKMTKQVTIEAKIVETTKNFQRELGIQWGFVDSYGKATNGHDVQDGSRSGSGRFPQGVTYGGTAQGFPNGLTSATGIPFGYAVNLPLSGAANGAIGLSLGKLLLDRFTLDVQLSAMEDQGKGRVLSNPRITTLDNHEAIIQSGSKIPFQTVANNTVTTSFVDAQIKLLVNPHITNDNMISMKIVADKSEPNWGRQVNGMPEITERKASTELIVGDGETTVIGGLYQVNKQESRRKVPWFADLPLIGGLFRTDARTNTYSELLIFITPKIATPETQFAELKEPSKF